MTVPALRYAKTSDGARIAYIKVGDGPPIIFGSNVMGDVQMYGLAGHHTRRMTDALADAGWSVVRYDQRGMGGSDRNASDLSFAGRIKDLTAVAGEFDDESHILAGWDVGAEIALGYAAQNPGRVSCLVLINPWRVGKTRYETIPAARALVSLLPRASEDWDYIRLTLANFELNFGDPQLAKELAAAFGNAVSASVWLSYREETQRIDVSELLPAITVPTLIVHEQWYVYGSMDLCREMATSLKQSHLVVAADFESEMTAIDEFIRSSQRPRERRPAPNSSLVLSVRETEVLQLMAKGRSNQQIADRLILSRHTVVRHVSNILAKTGMANRAEAAAYAVRLGIAAGD